MTQKVKLKKVYLDDKYNPMDIEGTVVNVNAKYNPIEVIWENGIKNSYNASNLIEL